MASAKGNLTPYWWKAKREDVHDAIFGVLKHLADNQTYVRDDYLRFARLYGNYEIMGLNSFSYFRSAESTNNHSRLTLNIVKSVIDTVTNKIAKNKPKPMFLTDGGDYSQQKKAKKLNKFTEGEFYGTNLYQIAPRIFLDACAFGRGWLKVYEKDNRNAVERVLPDEIIFDDTEAFYGPPRSIHQVKQVAREVLLDMFPTKKQAILNATDAQDQFGSVKGLADMVYVTESWHLPSGKDAKDGRHVIAVDNGSLLDETYENPYFPFVTLTWSERLIGWRGQGLAEELQGIQVEINRILRTITQILRLTVPKLFVEKGAKVVYAHLNNEIGGIIEFSGTKPTYDFLQAIPPDLFNQLERLYQRAYEISGVSALSAQAVKPAGLDSGKALREMNDIESERFILKGQQYEQFFLDVAKQFINQAKQIADREGNYEVKFADRKGVEVIKWKDIKLEEDQYIMQIFPASFLSNTPAGRLQDVQELLQAGFIDKDSGLKLLDFPDLESVLSLQNAAIEDIEMIIEAMVDEGKYQPPEPFQNLQLGIQKIQSAYLRAKANKVPEERLELLRRWINEASLMLQPPAPEMPMDQGMMPQAAPLGVPEAPPPSDMLPMETAQPVL